jgi:hypothetical protein
MKEKEEFLYEVGDLLVVLEDTGVHFKAGTIFTIQRRFHGVSGHAVYTDQANRYYGVIQKNVKKASKLHKVLK